jgi:hypothetical protein
MTVSSQGRNKLILLTRPRLSTVPVDNCVDEHSGPGRETRRNGFHVVLVKK